MNVLVDEVQVVLTEMKSEGKWGLVGDFEENVLELYVKK